MKKINALSLPFRAIGLCFIVCLLAITSCKKDKTGDGKLSETDLQTLKDWQSKHFDQNSILFSGMVPNWSNIYVNQLKDKIVYEVELTPTDNAFMTNGFLNKGDKNNYQSTSRFKLLILKDAKTDKITDGYYMSSISNEPVHYTQTDQFTGYIYFYNTKGNFINGWSFDAGKAVQGIRSGTYAGYKETMNPSLREKINMSNFGNGRIQVEAPGNSCYTMTIPVYATSCISVEDSPPICSIYIKGYVYGQFCPGVQISPDGSGGVIPDPIRPIGQTPVTTTVPEITDEFENYPCAKALVQKMKTLNSDIANLIKNAFNTNDLKNLNFVADPALAGTNIDGHYMRGNTTPESGVGFHEIGINPDVLNNSTQEFILATLYHEALHAYFAQKLSDLGKAEFDRQFLGVEVNGGRLLVQDEAHISMGYQRFVTGIKNTILAFNPGFDPNRAEIIAKSGIVQALPAESKINSQERNPYDPNNPGATGTKCLE
ncbi:SprT family zinc-dependent metalloprotease [Pedobacter nototheniae]|uniref:hypothetical protein n=1 Tax=Pedobacter nototheniae TaxID=2488994 RepID=UPI00103B8EED|nr:hypothetical protein [Pedobacter nototheniae]